MIIYRQVCAIRWLKHVSPSGSDTRLEKESTMVGLGKKVLRGIQGRATMINKQAWNINDTHEVKVRKTRFDYQTDKYTYTLCEGKAKETTPPGGKKPAASAFPYYFPAPVVNVSARRRIELATGGLSSVGASQVCRSTRREGGASSFGWGREGAKKSSI